MARLRPTMVIYHGSCTDGFAAAWAVHQRYSDASIVYVAADYKSAPPDVTNHHVLMVDFSYKRNVLVEMAQRAKSIIILDHHESAQKELAEFTVAVTEGCTMKEAVTDRIDKVGNVAAIFDMNYSGAMLAWFYCFPDSEPPKLLEYVQDYDLWKFEFGETRFINGWLNSHPKNFLLWSDLAKACEELLEDVVAQGRAIYRQRMIDINNLLYKCKRTMVIGGIEVPVANLPYIMASEAGHILSKYQPFSATYYDESDVRIFSLRSSKDCGINVATIAAKYGGGGHQHAAGFKRPLGWEGDTQESNAAS